VTVAPLDILRFAACADAPVSTSEDVPRLLPEATILHLAYHGGSRVRLIPPRAASSCRI
jgi:hypothetical protein